MLTGALAKPAQINFGDGDMTVQPIVGNLAKFVISVAADGSRIDGLVSWPEVRDNILVFNGPEHKIDSVGTVPVDAYNWPKFAIGREEQFTLKTPLSNGQLGTILIDTGSYFGVALPPAQWKAWRATHPNARTGYLSYVTPGAIGPQSVEEAWADEISLGKLTLTDVPVHEANPSEIQIDPKNYAGTLGLYALARLELVVDDKHAVAYARARPSPGPYYPGIERPGVERDASGGPLGQDWRIEGKVNLSTVHIRRVAGKVLVSDAAQKFLDGDHGGAIAEYTQAIEYDGNNDEAFLGRGLARIFDQDNEGGVADINLAIAVNPSNPKPYYYFGLYKYQHSDPSGAIADFTSAIALDSQFTPAYFSRGAVKQVMNDTPGAIADFDRDCELQPNDALPQLFREVLQRWSGRPPRDLSASLARWKNAWYRALGDYLSNHLSESGLMAAAADGKDSSVKTCEAYYFTGFVHFLNQDMAGAEARWKKCESTNQTGIYEYDFASNLLKFLGSRAKQ
jgi:tetratricopeptide (TPR) repeat protein